MWPCLSPAGTVTGRLCHLDPGCPGSHETLRHGEEGVGARGPGQTPGHPCRPQRPDIAVACCCCHPPPPPPCDSVSTYSYDQCGLPRVATRPGHRACAPLRIPFLSSLIGVLASLRGEWAHGPGRLWGLRGLCPGLARRWVVGTDVGAARTLHSTKPQRQDGSRGCACPVPSPPTWPASLGALPWALGALQRGGPFPAVAVDHVKNSARLQAPSPVSAGSSASAPSRTSDLRDFLTAVVLALPNPVLPAKFTLEVRAHSVAMSGSGRPRAW